MREVGIIDPTKVVRTALVDSSSVASLMLTTECMIFDEAESDEKWFIISCNYNLLLFIKEYIEQLFANEK